MKSFMELTARAIVLGVAVGMTAVGVGAMALSLYLAYEWLVRFLT